MVAPAGGAVTSGLQKCSTSIRHCVALHCTALSFHKGLTWLPGDKGKL